MADFSLNNTVISSSVDFEGSDGADNISISNTKGGGIMLLSRVTPAMITLL